MGGNLVSRWTDFLTTDGEKPTRHREGEFADWEGTRAELMAHWERGWAALLATIQSLKAEDCAKTVTIRRQTHTVRQAIVRALDHCAYHVGQMVYLSRLMHAGAGGRDWKWLTVAPGQSAALNEKLMGRGK
jgi:hypothetical protein